MRSLAVNHTGLVYPAMKNPLNSVLTRYRLSLQLRVKHLLHRNEEGIQINMENTASHETAYKLAHRADKASFWLDL
jgi:hypothetical protein